MQKGDIYSHKNFRFKNGEFASKLLVLLYIPPERKIRPFLFCLTTSQTKRRSLKEGCQPNWSEFFIPKNKEFFKENTWLQLHAIYPMEKTSVIQDCMTSYMKKEGALQGLTIRQILNCIKKSKDVEQEYAEWILKG